MIDLIIRNAKVHEKDTTTDIAIDKGIIIEIGSNIEYLAEKEMDVCNRLVIPAFIESLRAICIWISLYLMMHINQDGISHLFILLN